MTDLLSQNELIENHMGNARLKKIGQAIEWTPERLEEYVKCMKDPIYFAENYVKIITLDDGFVNIELYDYQREIIQEITEGRRLAVNASRQSGKCVGINTIVTIKLDSRIIKITMGELHEFLSEENRGIQDQASRRDRLCRMFDLWISRKEYWEACKEARSGNISRPSSIARDYCKDNKNSKKPIQRGTGQSSQEKSVRSDEKTCFGSFLQESVVWTQRALFSFQQKEWKIRREYKRINRKSREEQILPNSDRLLDRKGLFRGRSQRKIEGTPKNIYHREVNREIRFGESSGNISGKTREMAKYSQVKTVRRTRSNKSEKNCKGKLQDPAWREMSNRRSGNSLSATMERYGELQDRNYLSAIRNSPQAAETAVFRNQSVGKFNRREGIRARTGGYIGIQELPQGRWLFGDLLESVGPENHNRICGKHETEILGRTSRITKNSKYLHEKVNRKFTEVIDVEGIEVQTPSGFEPITKFNVTVPYEKYTVRFEGGRDIECADDHIFIDEHGNEIFAKDCLGVGIRTEDGTAKVTGIDRTDDREQMYDLTVDSVDHTYYTNGILSHNTTTAVCIILWYVLFNDYKTVGILANKGATSQEIMSRIQIAYEALPLWLQQGILVWNKTSFELENGSKVFSAATSASGIRGVSCLTGDTRVCVEKGDDYYYTEIENLINT